VQWWWVENFKYAKEEDKFMLGNEIVHEEWYETEKAVLLGN
jgi:hypothetical protein